MAAAQKCVRSFGIDDCPFHPGHKVFLQCEDCHGTLVCQICTTTIHRRHAFRQFKMAVEESAGKISSVLQTAKQETMPALFLEIKATKEKLQRNNEDYQRKIQHVKKRGENLKKEIDIKTEEEVSRLEFFLKENNDMLTTHQSEIEQLQIQLDKDIKQLEETLRTGTDCLVYDRGADVDKTLHINIPEMPSVTTCTFTPCANIKNYIAKAFGEIKVSGKTQTIDPPTDVASTTTTLYKRELSYGIQGNCICPWLDDMAWIYDWDSINKLHLVDNKGEEQRTIELDMKINSVYVRPTTKEVYISCYKDNSVRTVSTDLQQKQTKVMFSTKPKKIQTNVMFHTSDYPAGIACVGEDRMVVSTYDKGRVNIRVCLYSMTGELYSSYVYKGKKQPCISVCPRTNTIAVLGGDDGMVTVLTNTLRELYTYRAEGLDRNRHKEFACDTGVFVDRYLLLGDYHNSMIHILEAKTGRCIKSVQSDSFFHVTALAVQQNGDLWVGCKKPNKLSCVKYLKDIPKWPTPQCQPPPPLISFID